MIDKVMVVLEIRIIDTYIVKLKTIILTFQYKANEPYYEPVMIDFAISRIRGDDESDEDWYEEKLAWDEENVIGQIMSNIFRTKGYDWSHKDIYRYFRDDNGIVHAINNGTKDVSSEH